MHDIRRSPRLSLLVPMQLGGSDYGPFDFPC